MAFDPLSFAITLLVSVVLSAVLAPKPKKPSESNQIQREGVDEDLPRLYGKRRVFPVITDSATSDRTVEPSENAGITNDTNAILPATPLLNTPRRTWNRLTTLYFQGPLCVTGRQNAPIANTDYADLNPRVSDLPFDDASLKSIGSDQNYGCIGVVYKQGGLQDTFAAAIPERCGEPGDRWTKMVHVTAMAFQTIIRKIAFSGIPQISFDLKSNPLWDPRVDALGVIDTPASWTGRHDNPALQILDYLLDEDFGVGVNVNDIDLASFSTMANIADTPVSRVVEKTVTSTSRFFTPGAFGLGAISDIYINDNGAIINNAMIYTETKQVVETVPLLRSNILLSTSDTLAENLEQLLAACRGARLFKSKNGKWRIAPAWLLQEHLVQTINVTETGSGPYKTWFAVDAVDMTVTVNDNPATISSVQNSVDNTGTNTNLIPYKNATFNFDTSTLTIYFDDPAPSATIGRRYRLSATGNSLLDRRIEFLASGTEPTVNATTDTWVVDAGFLRKPAFDVNYNGSTFFLREDVDLTDTPQQGIILSTSQSPGDVIKVTYNPATIPSLSVAAHIVDTPENLSPPLDYNATQDANGKPLLIPVEPGEYSTVSSDDKLNQCTVRFPDEFTEFKTNDVIWPEPFGERHLAYLEEDNNKELTQVIEINSVIDKTTAYDLAEFTVRKSRHQDALSYVLGLDALILEPNDIVQVTDASLNVGDHTQSITDYYIVASSVLEDATSVRVDLLRYDPEDFAYVAPDLEEFQRRVLPPDLPTVAWENPAYVPPLLNQTSSGGTLYWYISATTGIDYEFNISYCKHEVHPGTATFYGSGSYVYRNERVYFATTDTSEIPSGVATDWTEYDQYDSIWSSFWITLTTTTNTSYEIPYLTKAHRYVFRLQHRSPQQGWGDPIYHEEDIDLTSYSTGAWFQPSAPLAGGTYTPPAFKVGEKWFNTTTTPPRQYEWNGSSWVFQPYDASLETLCNLTRGLTERAFWVDFAPGTPASWFGYVNVHISATPPAPADAFHYDVRGSIPQSFRVDRNDSDVWVDKSDNNKMYLWDRGRHQWRDAATSTLRDWKVQNFMQPSAPTGPKLWGDYWFDTNNDAALASWLAGTDQEFRENLLADYEDRADSHFVIPIARWDGAVWEVLDNPIHAQHVLLANFKDWATQGGTSESITYYQANPPDADSDEIATNSVWVKKDTYTWHILETV